MMNFQPPGKVNNFLNSLITIKSSREIVQQGDALYEGLAESNEHIYPTIKRCTNKNQ
jgi:hypothetical protein